jgi:methylated-DNA-[protein]-cysteine S-methyltransferase
MYKYSIFKTSLGYMGAVFSPKGLHMIILPKNKQNEVKSVLEEHYLELYRDDKKFVSLAKKIKNYFDGEKIVFKENIDVSGATPFEMKVWDMVFGIPYGEVRSYAWVAEKVGEPNKVRAVGQALKRNRLPIIIPCHRVVSKAGDLGGFSGGIGLKYKLLKIEGRMW